MVVILGPTAAGKSDLAAALALAVDGEVVGADSMQVYRGMDAGTAKPDAATRARVPHHLIDIVEPDREFNLGDFVRAADEAIRDIGARGRLPIVAGGTGMYLRGLLKGIDPAPPRNPRLRAALEALADRRGEPHLHHLLAGLDPAAAAAVGTADRMRLVRGLERVLSAGHPAGRERWGGADRYRSVKVGLALEPERLRARIEARVDAMFAGGLVEETRRLLGSGVPPDSSPLKALGYRQVVEHLQAGEDPAAAAPGVKLHTWRFSRRQMTWFRREEEVRWFDVPPGGAAGLVAKVREYVMLAVRERHPERGRTD